MISVITYYGGIFEKVAIPSYLFRKIYRGCPNPQGTKILNDKVRSLHVYRTYFPDPPGGVQEVIRQIAISTSRLDVDSRIFALSPDPYPEKIERPEGAVIRFRSWAAPASCDLGGMAAFSRFAQACAGSDIVHYHFPWPFADLLHAAVKPAVPAVMTYHSDVVRQKFLGSLYSPLMWRMLRSMRFVVATSPAYARTSPVLSHPSIRERVRVIPSGIDEETYSKEADASVFRRIGISASEPYFLFIGVLRYYKGLHTLIRAATEVDARIVIAGSGPEKKSLKGLQEQHGASNVVFAGHVSDAEKNALLGSCRALVLPSHLRSEAFGMVLVEAAMFGRPLISCEIGTGTSYINEHRKTGFVVPPEAPEQLAAAMNELLRDDVLAEMMGRAARERYEQHFSGRVLGRAYADLYREALES
jgi:glycosyltransferase involved in cell wall biosynthesis